MPQMDFYSYKSILIPLFGLNFIIGIFCAELITHVIRLKRLRRSIAIFHQAPPVEKRF